VAAGLVVHHAPAEPDDLAHAQVFAQPPLDVAALTVRIAVGVEQALLGDERRALTVDVDGTALVNDRGAVAIETLGLEHLARDQIVLVPGKIQAATQAAPGVEVPIDTAHGAAAVHDTGWADIAHPGVIVGHFHDAHALG